MRHLLLLWCIGWSLWAGSIMAQDEEQLDDLLWADDIMVITASRGSLKASQAPSSITVITSEEIEHSGALTIMDLLRRVPGIDFMQPTSGAYNISIRGFNDLLSRRILLMVDNHSLYSDFHGLIDWQALPIPLSAVKQIEIIRGPGSALYGANAYLGIIHIITKGSEELPQLILSSTIGTNRTYSSNAIASHIRQNFSFRASVGWGTTGRWQTNEISFEKGAALTIETIRRESYGFLRDWSETRNLTFDEGFASYYEEQTGEPLPTGLTFDQFFYANIGTDSLYNAIREELESTFGEAKAKADKYLKRKRGAENYFFNFRSDYYASRNLTFSLETSYSQANTDNIMSLLPGALIMENQFGYLHFDTDWREFLHPKSNLILRAHWLNQQMSLIESNFIPNFCDNDKIANNIWDAEIIHEVTNMGDIPENTILTGLNLRYSNASSNLFTPYRTEPYPSYDQLQLGFYWQIQYRLMRNVGLHYGERYDYHPRAGFHQSPRASLNISLKNHTLRFIFSRAFRNPSYFESYTDNTFIRGGYLEGFHNYTYIETGEDSLGIPEKKLRNNRALMAESIKSLEFGWQKLKKVSQSYALSWDLSFFYNELQDLINLMGIEEKGHPTSPWMFFNFGSYKTLGGEISIRWDSPILSIFSNYSQIHISDMQLDSATLIEKFPNANTEPIKSGKYQYLDLPWAENTFEVFRRAAQQEGHTPQHKFNMGFELRLASRWHLTSTLFYTGPSKNWVSYYNGMYMSVPAYWLTNAALTFNWKNTVFTLAAKNLLNNRHYEYPQNSYNIDNYHDINSLYLFNLDQGKNLGRIISFNIKFIY